MKSLVSTDKLPVSLLASIAERDATLWVDQVPSDLPIEDLAKVIGLPWREVYLKEHHSGLLEELTQDKDADLIRRRGFVQVIQSDPSAISLPLRALPVFVLEGGTTGESEFDSSLRKMALLGRLRHSGVRRLVVLSAGNGSIPVELPSLIDGSFHPFITFVTDNEEGAAAVQHWAEKWTSGPPLELVQIEPALFLKDLLGKYREVYPVDRVVVRMRQRDGSTGPVDISDADDTERPILANYEVIQERDLATVAPVDLTEKEFVAFFEDGQSSWRPYSAGLPWNRDHNAQNKLRRILGKLNTIGPEENRIAYISSEPGAGGTTFARMIAFEAASEGYPTLVAKPIPFAPDPLPVVGFLNRCLLSHQHNAQPQNEDGRSRRSLYETPWIIVFDKSHFENREGSLLQFVNELTKSGRPAVLLYVSSHLTPMEFHTVSFAVEVGSPGGLIEPDEAEELGRHLNRFLANFSSKRTEQEWRDFHSTHGVARMGGSAAFWITLSFWLRNAVDITQDVQTWIYNKFNEESDDDDLKLALVEIAALSTERLPLDEGLLPPSNNEWPLALRLEDKRRDLSALGLIRVKSEIENYWGLAHDLLGRLLLNALFADYGMRTRLGFAEARDVEHLRFLVLKRIALRPSISETQYRALAEQFATVIFKIDPGQGRRQFVQFWREVLQTLDEMPKLLRDSSRVFRHHSAISRRRIARLDDPLYEPEEEEKIELLDRAVTDIHYALESIDRSDGEEPDINLYNSLANAYLDLARVLGAQGASDDRLDELRRQANEATRRAYGLNPTNPWVVETHIKNLLSIAESDPNRAVDAALEALLAVYEALNSADPNLRTHNLGTLGSEALAVIFKHSPSKGGTPDLRNPVDVLVATWHILATSNVSGMEEELLNLPQHTAERALEVLSNPAGEGDLQVNRLRYGILSAARPFAFSERLAQVENLYVSDQRLSPQLRLEYALLLFQVGRATEGDQEFRRLRGLWRSKEHFVRIPDPLHWLRDGERESLLTVQARTGSEQSFRPMALVSEFANKPVPFRPEEFDVRTMRPGTRFRAHVSFGHNGPFLRPLTAGPHKSR